MSRAVFRQPLTAGARDGITRGPSLRLARGTRLHAIWGAATGLLLLALAACTAGPMGGASDNQVGPSGPATAGGPDLATQQACRQRVNEMYEIQNRGDIYAANPSVNSPFSANYQPDVPTRGLSNQFAYDRSLAECEHNSANGTDEPGLAPPASPTAQGH